MQKELTITIQAEDEKNPSLINSLIFKELKKNGIKTSQKDDITTVFVKKSVDARHGQLKLHLRYKVYINEKPESAEDLLPKWKKADGKKSVIIVGSGPAGLFGALKLLEYGIKPVIIERGKETSDRRKDIAKISTQDLVSKESNYCFGEGGAGTFSDGKLYTRSNKRGNISSILQIFNIFGADEKILTDAHPHIGTDKLPKVINNMRSKIIELGGEVYFNTKVIDFEGESLPLAPAAAASSATLSSGANKNTLTAPQRPVISGVKTINTETGEEKIFTADAVILATGHSASDIYYLLAKIAPKALEAKTFAIGVRVEHPRELIDKIQYHGKQTSNLGAAEYRVTTQIDGRGVYSFCMCPGGFVVPSSSGPEEIVVNGMSAAARNSKWSDAAIVVETRPEDIPENYRKAAEEMGCADLAGLLFRTKIEQDAFKNGDGQAAPAQRVVDFIANKKSKELPASSYTPGVVSSNLNEWLPEHISKRLAKGFEEINKNMHGFICSEALMIAPETRTSTPVRICRDNDTLECIALKNLYPAGEGSGYSGGIVSSAMDGIKCAKQIATKLMN